MGATKIDIYEKDTITIANMAKVLAHPARVAILQFISKQEPCICNDIVKAIGLSQATISQHLKVIGESGLLKGEFVGPSKCYCLDVDNLEVMRHFLNGFFATTRSNCC